MAHKSYAHKNDAQIFIFKDKDFLVLSTGFCTFSIELYEQIYMFAFYFSWWDI